MWIYVETHRALEQLEYERRNDPLAVPMCTGLPQAVASMSERLSDCAQRRGRHLDLTATLTEECAEYGGMEQRRPGRAGDLRGGTYVFERVAVLLNN
jgi:hypothetical protein